MKKNRLAKLLSLVLFFAVLTSSIYLKAQAQTLPIGIFGFDLKLRGGVTNCTYYIDPSAAKYEKAIESATKLWETATAKNSTSARVKFSKVNSAANATIIFAVPSTFLISDSSIKGYVLYYDGSYSVNSVGGNPQSSWTKCYVHLRGNLSITTTEAGRTIGHEIGHCLGLSHAKSESDKSIMHPSNVQPNTIAPTSVDAGLIETLY